MRTDLIAYYSGINRDMVYTYSVVYIDVPMCVGYGYYFTLQINMHNIRYNNMVIDLISILPKFYPRSMHTFTRTY